MLQNTPINKRKDFGPKSSLPRRTGCQFTQNTSPEGPKDRPEPLQASVQDPAAEKRSKMENQGGNRTEETACQEGAAGKQKETGKPGDVEK